MEVNSLASTAVENLWWEKETEEVHLTIFQYINYWNNTQSSKQMNNLINARLYHNREVANLSVAQYVTTNTFQSTPTSQDPTRVKFTRLSYNLVQSCIDTLTAKITKNKVKPTFLTSGGILEQRTRAQQLNKALFGIFDEGGAYKQNPKAFRNSLIFGDGYVKIFFDNNNRIKFENVYLDELFVDPSSAYYGEPKEMYQIRFMARSAVINLSFVKEDEHLSQLVKECPTIDIELQGQLQKTIVVIESWRQKVGKQKGRHVIVIQNGTLVDEDYNHEFFPFARISYLDPTNGYWAQGLAEILREPQREINRLMQSVQQAMYMIGYPYWLLERGSKINTRHIINEIGTFIEYTNTRPDLITPAPINPMIIDWVKQLIQYGYEQSGISQLSAASQKPAGLNSGKALQEFNNIETERFYTTGQKYEDLFVDQAYIVCELLKNKPNYIVSAHSKDLGLEKIVWGDIMLPRDSYVVQCFPTSALPTTPAARVEVVEQMLQGGFIEPEIAQDLLDFPDLDSYNQRHISPYKLALSMCENILFKEEYMQPEEFMNLELTKKIAQYYWCWARLVKIPENRIEMLRQFIDEVVGLLAQGAQVAPVAPAQQMLEQQMQNPMSVSSSAQPLTGLQ